MQSSFTVRVPATIANLGPGFDCLGLALDIYNEAAITGGDGFSITLRGEGIKSLSSGRENLIYRAISGVFERLGEPVPGLSIICENAVPLGRGMGSSAAAIVAGLKAANRLAGDRLSPDELLSIGIGIEGHPDNVVPALLGGCRAAVSEGDRLVQAEIPVCGDWQYVLFIPDSKKSTLKARSLLARQVSREDAVFNLGRVALLTRAFITGDAALLRVATQDRLHQPQRQAIFPPMDRLFAAALAAGADGVFLAGSGPTIVAVARRGGEAIGQAMAAEAGQAGVSGRVRTARLDKAGAQIL